ncbi:MAG: hypothetical protein K2O42_05140, partial [Oscillospiraceae bacterium]|nr:hypothetical protein [Oscillospiraceae bacterium]
VAAGILIMLVIMGFTLHSMTRIDELNQRHREQQKGEALASRLVTTVATTSVWDALRSTESETVAPVENTGNPENFENPENPEQSPEFSENAGNPPEIPSQNQTFTETISE